MNEIDEVILVEGVAEEHKGIKCVPSADDTNKEKSKSKWFSLLLPTLYQRHWHALLLQPFS